MNPQSRSHLWVLLAYIVAAIVVTWPLVLNFMQGIPYGGDGFQFIWNGWWVSKAINDPALSIWWTPYQYAPGGTSLVLHDLSLVNAYMQAMLRPMIGDFAAYNTLVLSHYVLAAWGAYILAWHLTGNRAGSVVAGVIYGFSVHHAMHLPQLSTASSGWLPLSVYYLLKYTRDGGWKDGVLSVAMLLLTALTHSYHFAFAAVVFFGLMLIGQIGLREHLGGVKRWARAIQPGVVALLVLSPLIVDIWQELKVRGTQWQVEMGKNYYIDPAWLILPPPAHPVLGVLSRSLEGTIPGNATEGVASLGIVAILLGLLSWFRRDRTTRAWCWLGLILLVLGLGTTITVLGHKLGIPGPFLLWSRIAGLNLVRAPARFVEPLTLALGMASAGWIAGLGPSWHKGLRRLFLLWALPILIVFETLVIPIPISGSEYRHPALARLGEIYREATGEANPPDLLINFPLLPERRQFLLHQTIHEIPTHDGALSYPPPGALDYYLDFNWNPEYLKTVGIGLVLFHPWAAESRLGEHFDIPPDAKGRAEEWAGQRVEPLVFFRDVMGYRIAYEDERLVVLIPE